MKKNKDDLWYTKSEVEFIAILFTKIPLSAEEYDTLINDETGHTAQIFFNLSSAQEYVHAMLMEDNNYTYGFVDCLITYEDEVEHSSTVFEMGFEVGEGEMDIYSPVSPLVS